MSEKMCMRMFSGQKTTVQDKIIDRNKMREMRL